MSNDTKTKKPTPFSLRLSVEERQLLDELAGTKPLGASRLPNNINQLARAANTGSLLVTDDVLHDLNEPVQFKPQQQDRGGYAME